MRWYVAHAILYFRLKSGKQTRYRIHENLHLVRASSFEDARAKGERVAAQAAGDDMGTLTYDGEPVEYVFAGIRKIVLCENPTELPEDGDELTYNELEVDSWESLQSLAAGRPTPLVYEAVDQSDPAGDAANNNAATEGRPPGSTPHP